MPSPFEALTLKNTADLVAALAPDAGDKEALDFYSGAMWRDGDAWLGQKPPASSPEYLAQLAAIEAAQVGENIVGEVIHRHRAGVLGREPRWGFVPRRALGDGDEPTADEAALIAEAEAALTEWWDRRKPLATLQTALPTALLARRAPLRLLVPAGLRDANGNVVVKAAAGESPLVAALDYLYIETPDAALAGVFTDDATRREAGVFTYTAYPAAVPGLPPTGSGEDRAQVAYVDDNRQTIIVTLGKDGVVEESPPYALGGRLPLYDLTREALITPQVRQGQKAINLTLTQMIRNVNLAGSLERIFVNLAPPGRLLNKATGQPWQQGDAAADRQFAPEPLPVGAGVSAFLRGAELRDKEGNLTGYSNGTVNYRDPVPVDTFTQTRQEFRAAILAQVSQGHVLISGDATASGESRKQARAEFEASLEMTKTALDDAGRWLLETALALAAVFAGQAGRYDGLRCEFAASVDAGPQSAQERQQIVAEYQAGLASKETAMSLLGVDDTAAEMARIDEEQTASDTQTLAVVSGRPQALAAAGAQPGGAGQATDPASVLQAEMQRGAA